MNLNTVKKSVKRASEVTMMAGAGVAFLTVAAVASVPIALGNASQKTFNKIWN